jgi:hypothetical protein
VRLFIFLLLPFLLLSCAADANDLQMINSLSEADGQAFGKKTQREVFNQFLEYPLSKKSSIGAITQASHIESSHNDKTTAYAINSVEFFNRYKLLSAGKFGLTMHNSYKPKVLSGYNENKYLALMPKQDDYEMRLLLAFNMPDRLVNTVVQNKTPYFARTEIAYRRKFSNPFDQIRFAFWGGVKIDSKFSLLFQDNIDWNVRSKSTRTDNSYSNLSNFSASKDANNVTTTSILYHSSPNLAWQLGYVYRLSGNNPFYDNKALIAGLWSSF